MLSDLAHVEDEHAPHLRAAGLTVLTSRAPGTFPPQRMLVARARTGLSPRAGEVHR